MSRERSATQQENANGEYEERENDSYYASTLLGPMRASLFASKETVRYGGANAAAAHVYNG